MADIDRYLALEHELPRSHRMLVVAQDPAVTDAAGHVILDKVEVPASWLSAGPQSHRFHVVDFDATKQVFHGRHVIHDPTPGPYAGFGYDEQPSPGQEPITFEQIEADPALRWRFHAQNVYAIAARTLATFEEALGRRHPWAFDSHQLYLVPHAFEDENAYYSRDDHALYFGYAGGGDDAVYTCLSHDIVSHEVTHAILDGLKPGYNEPGLPDQAAFHEAFADIVALLSVVAMPNVVRRLISSDEDETRIPGERLSHDALESNALLGLAEQFGSYVTGMRGEALRRSLRDIEPTTTWQDEERFDEPHNRGEILVAIISRTFLDMWLGRLERILSRSPDGKVDIDVVVDQATRSARHLLNMCIRGLDYAPPIEFEYVDYLDAILLSDQVAAPDDAHGYRASLRRRFGEFGIETSRTRTIGLLSPMAGVDEEDGGVPLTYHNLRFEALQNSRDEAFSFIWDNAERLGISREFHVAVTSVRTAVRTAPDGFVVRETIADYVQTVSGTVGQARAAGVDVDVVDPATGELLPASLEVQLRGGGTLVFGEFGQLRFHQRKPINDWDRQRRRLAYLVRHGLGDTRGRFGFSFGRSRGQQFAEMHRRQPTLKERW